MAMTAERPGPTDPARWAATEEELAGIRETISCASTKRTVSGRTQFVRDVMLRDEWSPKLIPHLAEMWGVSESRIRQISTDASRSIRDAINKPLLRAQLMSRLDESFRRAKQETFSPAKGSEAMTKAVLAAAQIAGIDGKDAGPSITINVGAEARSAVLDAIWGPAPELPEAIVVSGEAPPSDTPTAERADSEAPPGSGGASLSTTDIDDLR